ncbi:RNA polymerase iii transcription initiation factor b [Anaeramoeba ignava]|uniref:RNA polymerase iii transcription initiation factor b n=1 Tax=Anaeramoeba ignava TaxID=1746090 RepID=A0A9Q0L9G6_ANAIG|nr:RNA polymerase iii transcription initiation factor b [Anaeramoeba ignava]
MKKTCSNYWKRIKKLIGKPKFLDFIGDDVIWRIYTIIFLSTFFIFTFGIAIRYLLEGTKIKEDEIEINLDFYKFPNKTILFYGEPFNAELRVSRKYKYDGIKNCQVTVNASSLNYSQMNELTSDLSLEQINIERINSLIVAGDTIQYSDSDGFATFSNLSIISGSSQTVQLNFYAKCSWESAWKPLGPSSFVNFSIEPQFAQTSFPLSLKSKISCFKLNGYSEINQSLGNGQQYDMNFTVYMNQDVPQYLKNVSISLVTGIRDWNYPEYDSSIYYETISQFLDDQGFYHLQVNFLGSTFPYMLMTAYIEGTRLCYYSGDKISNRKGKIYMFFPSTIKGIQIIENGSISVKEGEPFDKPWKILLTNNSTQSVYNAPVFAKISKQCNISVSENQDQLEYSKELLNAVELTNENGIATFSDLKFSVSGFTRSDCSFQIKFVSDYYVVETTDIQVNSSVSDIIWMQNMSKLYIDYISLEGMVSVPIQSDLWPMIKVIDENQKGIANKLVEFEISNFTFQPYQFTTDQNGFCSIYLNFPLTLPKENFTTQTYKVKVDDFENNYNPNVNISHNDLIAFPSAINISNWNANINAGDLLNLNISILDFFGEVIENQTFYLSWYISPSDLPMAFATLPLDGYQVINSTEIISTRIFGIEMRTQLCFIVSTYYPLSLENFQSQQCYDFNLLNKVEYVSLSSYPIDDLIPCQPFGSESIIVEVFGNFSGISSLLVQVSVVNALFDPYGDLLGENDSYRIRNYTNVLYQEECAIIEYEGGYYLNLTDFTINDIMEYYPFIIDDQIVWYQHNPFEVQVFVNGIPSADTFFAFLAFPKVNFLMGLSWNTSLPFLSGVNGIWNQPEVYLVDQNYYPLEGYYIYAGIDKDSEHNTVGALFDDFSRISYWVRSKTRTDENGLATWNMSLFFINSTTEVNCVFAIYNYDQWMGYSVSINISQENVNIQSFNLPTDLAVDTSLLYYPVIYAFNDSGFSLPNKYVIILLSENYAANYSFLGYSTTDNKGLSEMAIWLEPSNPDLDTEYFKFQCDSIFTDTYSLVIQKRPTHLTLNNFSSTGFGIGYPFPLINMSNTFSSLRSNSKFVIGSIISSLYTYDIPIAGKIISVEIEENPGNGKLDPLTTMAITNDYGQAIFNLRMESGKTGNYSFKFTYDNDIHVSTNLIKIKNPINSVAVEYFDFPKELKIGDKFSAKIIVDFEENINPNSNFEIQIITQCSQASAIGDVLTTNPSGVIYLHNLKFDSLSGESKCLEEDEKDEKVKAQIGFSILGIESEYHTFKIISPDKVVFTKAISSLKSSFMFWVISFLLIFPFMLNSLNNHSWFTFLMVLALICVFAVFLPRLIPKSDNLKSPQFAALSILEGILTAFFFIVLVLIFVFFIPQTQKYFENSIFIHQRLSSYLSLFKRLLPIGGKVFLKRKKYEKILNQENINSENNDLESDNININSNSNSNSNSECENININKEKKYTEIPNNSENDEKMNKQKTKLSKQEIENILSNPTKKSSQKKKQKQKQKQKQKGKSSFSCSKFCNWMKKLYHECIHWIKSKFIDEEDNPHQEYEKYSDFFYPQRLIAAFWLWILLSALVILLLTRLIQKATFMVIFSRQEIIGEVQKNNCFKDKPSLSDYESSFSIPGILLMNEISQNCSFSNNPLDSSFSNYIYSFSRYEVEEIMNAISVTAGISGFVAFIILVLLWRSLFKKYRKRIMILRQGKKPFPDFESANPVNVTSFTNTQIWVGLISFVFLWILVFIILFLIPGIYWFISDRVLTRFIGISISIIIAFIVYKIVFGIILQKIVAKYLIKNGKVINRSIFSYYEFVKFFMTIFTGATAAVKKFLKRSGGLISSVFKLGEKKSVDESYASMLFIDHETNNPIIRVFAHYLSISNLAKQRIYNENFSQKSESVQKENLISPSIIEYEAIYSDFVQIEKIRKKFLLLLTLSTNQKIRDLRNKIIEENNKRIKFLEEKEEQLRKMIEEENQNQNQNKNENENEINLNNENQLQYPLLNQN